MPSPWRSASRIAQASPVPAQMMLGLDGAIASAPIACTGMLSETGRNVAPLSADFHTPPDAAPTYQTRLLPGTPVIAAMRPPSAGPSSWKRNGSGIGGAGRCCDALAGRCCAPADTAMAQSDATAKRDARRIAEVSRWGVE